MIQSPLGRLNYRTVLRGAAELHIQLHGGQPRNAAQSVEPVRRRLQRILLYRSAGEGRTDRGRLHKHVSFIPQRCLLQKLLDFCLRELFQLGAAAVAQPCGRSSRAFLQTGNCHRVHVTAPGAPAKLLALLFHSGGADHLLHHIVVPQGRQDFCDFTRAALQARPLILSVLRAGRWYRPILPGVLLTAPLLGAGACSAAQRRDLLRIGLPAGGTGIGPYTGRLLRGGHRHFTGIHMRELGRGLEHFHFSTALAGAQPPPFAGAGGRFGIVIPGVVRAAVRFFSAGFLRFCGAGTFFGAALQRRDLLRIAVTAAGAGIGPYTGRLFCGRCGHRIGIRMPQRRKLHIQLPLSAQHAVVGVIILLRAGGRLLVIFQDVLAAVILRADIRMDPFPVGRLSGPLTEIGTALHPGKIPAIGVDLPLRCRRRGPQHPGKQHSAHQHRNRTMQPCLFHSRFLLYFHYTDIVSTDGHSILRGGIVFFQKV